MIDKSSFFVVFVENEGDRLHDVVVSVAAVHALSVFVDIVIEENDLLLMLDCLLDKSYIIINCFVAVFTSIEADHVAL